MVWTKKYPQLRIIKKLSTVDNPFCIFRSGGNYVRRTTSGLPQSDREYSRFAVIAEIAPINRNASLLYDAASKSACVCALSGRPALARGAGARDIFSKCRALRRFYDETINFRISPPKRYVLTRGEAHAHALRVRILFALSDCLRGYLGAAFLGNVFRQFERERIIRRNSGMSLSPVSILLLFTSPCLAPAITGSRTGVSG